MRIKTYTGPDLDTVLDQARREMGPAALVLDRRELHGDSGKCVEIRVGVDRPIPGETDVRDELLRLSREVLRLQDRSTGVSLDRRVCDDDSPCVPKPPTTLQGAQRRLLRSGLSEDLVARFAAIAARHLPPRHDLAGVARATERGLEALVELRPLEKRPRVSFIVGPPGVGKSTTTAKLAARQNGPVLWVQADDERIGADEQAAIFSRHVGAQLVHPRTPDGLRAIVGNAVRGAHVFVDTCGIGAADGDRLAAVDRLRQAVPSAQTLLLLPAGLHHDEARAVVDRFRPLRPSAAAFCKVDDTGRIGELVTALDSAELPLSFVTTGHTIPDDLEEVTPICLARLLLEPPRAGHQEMLA